MTNALRFAGKKVYTYDTVFTFGQYKGQSVKAILYDDPEYLLWCEENLQNTDWDIRVLEEATELAFHSRLDDYLHSEMDYGDWGDRD